MNGIEETIDGVERLYRTVTGKELPSSDEPYAPIPAERNPGEYVAQQVERLTSLLSGPEMAMKRPVQVPPMSVWETESELLLCLEMPGVVRDHLHVQAMGRTVHVHGDRGRPSATGARLTLAETGLGSFQRVISLPPNARSEDLSAKIGDGMLELRIPKSMMNPVPARSVPVL